MITQVKRILLVEDNPNDIELTLMALAEHNVSNEVVVTRDGEEALDYLHRRGSFENREEGNPTVVLLDLKMPKVDGLSALRQIRSDPDLKFIPVVLLTSSDEESDVAEGYNLGVNAYVVKPVDFHEFVDAIKKVGLFWSVTNVAPPMKATGNRSPSQPRIATGGTKT